VTPEPLDLCLFVAGSTPASRAAISNLTALCDRHLDDRYALEVVDIVADPARAEREGVLAVPLLVRRSPGPICRIVGDLSRTDRVLRALGIGAGAAE